jgi:hypothetical protein
MPTPLSVLNRAEHPSPANCQVARGINRGAASMLARNVRVAFGWRGSDAQ